MFLEAGGLGCGTLDNCQGSQAPFQFLKLFQVTQKPWIPPEFFFEPHSGVQDLMPELCSAYPNLPIFSHKREILADASGGL